MLQSDRKNSSSTLVLLLTILFLIIVLDYLVYNRFLYPKSANDKYLIMFCTKFHPIMAKDYLLRIIYTISLICFVNVGPSMHLSRGMTKETRYYYIVTSIILTIIFVIGFLKIPVYDIFIYPLVLVAQAIITAKAFSFIKVNFNETAIFGINQSNKGKAIFKLALSQNEKMTHLVIPNANYGIICEGGTGCGKSASIIKPLVISAAENGYAGLVYDYNGNPNLESNPVLTRCAMWGINKRLNENVKNGADTKLAFLNFTDLTKTVRVNPLPKYVTTKLDMINISSSILKNLDKSWKEKMDFWGQNAVQIFTAALHTLQKNYEDLYDIPHAVAIVLSRHDKFLKFIARDEEVCRDFMPVYTAYLNNAEGQLAGAVSSAQSPLSKLDTPEIFWVLSKDELDMDITNKEHPTLLCIGNDPMLSEALSAVISALTYICMMNMNQPGRVKSIFCFDEIPSVILYKVDDFIATCRKYHVCSIFGLQTHEQFKRDYGDKSADVIRNTLGNFFFGSTGDIKTAEYFSNVIGTIKKKDISYTEGDNSSSSSERMQNEKEVQPRQIMGQPIGHFMGKIIGGEPNYFNLQFDFFRTEEEDPLYLKNTEIPSFANYFKSDDKEDVRKCFYSDVQNNYRKIYKEINKLLDDTDNDENLATVLQEVHKYSSGYSDEQKKAIIENLQKSLGVTN